MPSNEIRTGLEIQRAAKANQNKVENDIAFAGADLSSTVKGTSPQDKVSVITYLNSIIRKIFNKSSFS